MGWIKNIFGGGAVKSIENIASEWIQTDIEKAEAQTLMIKTLDPNGLMRRDLSNRVTLLYTIYILTALLLISLEFFGIGSKIGGDISMSSATDKITDLFLPITGMFTAIVSASFGVNYVNTKKDK
tara:strand:- start:816 stop:1190 length:375 start_codon:yes stop_codon:yes gene_type:complete